MARGGGPICRYFCSPATFSPASRSRCSTTATTPATSPTSTTRSKASCAAWTPSPRPIPTGAAEAPDPATSSAPYRLYNIGNHSPVALLDYIAAIENALGKKAKLELLPQQPGDVEETYADVEALKQATGFQPATPLDQGIERFVAWYRDYYRV